MHTFRYLKEHIVINSQFCNSEVLLGLDIVVHTVISATPEPKIERMPFEVSLGKKLVRPPSQPINWEWWHTLVTPVTWVAVGRRISV
jgi:hypothetical protein